LSTSSAANDRVRRLPALGHIARRVGAAALAALICQAIPLAIAAGPASASPLPPTAAAWPASWTAYKFANGSDIVDPEGESGISPDDVDVSSDGGTNPSVYTAYDGTNVFFRVRLLGDPTDSKKGGFDSAFWLVQVETASDNVIHAVIGLNGKPVDTDYVYVADSAGGTVTQVYATPFDNSAPAAGAGARAVADGLGQWFVDFQVPFSYITTVSGDTITPATPVRLIFGSSQAANLATINKDALTDSSSTSLLGATPLRGADATSTSVSCTPSGSVAYGSTKTCTVTVTDTAATSPAQPTGSVSLTAVDGTLSASSCTLAGATASTSTCSVTFTATTVGSGSVAATYAGDATHNASNGSTAVTVSTAKLTVTVNNASRNYGAGNPAFSVGYSGFVGTDNAASLGGSVSYATAANSASGAGTYPVTASGLTSSKYAFNYVAGSLTVGTVTLTVTALNAQGAYGQTPGTLSASYNGFVNGDSSLSLGGTLSCLTTATSSSSVGSYPITCSGLTSSNYTFTYVAGSYSVMPATPTITSATPPTLTYGDALPSDPTGGDTASVPGTFSYSPVAGSVLAAGTHTVHVTFTPTDTTDYTSVHYDISVVVNPAALNVTAHDADRLYGAANPGFSATVTGYVNGDDAGDLVGTLSCSSTANSTSAPADYPISCTGLSGANYDVKYVDGTLSVGKASLTVTADPTSRPAGAADPAFTVSYDGFVGSDNAGDLGGTLSCASTADASSVPGDYAITCSGLTSDLYDISFVQGTLTVDQATPTITHGTPPTLTYGDGLPTDPTGGDTASVPGAFTYNPEPGEILHAGTHTVHVTFTPTDGASYATVEYDVTIDVNPAPLSVTADSAQRDAGTGNPAFSAHYDGFVNGDDSSALSGTLSCSSTADSGSVAGNYSISCGGVSSTDYDINFVDGTLTVNDVQTPPAGDTTDPGTSSPNVRFVAGTKIATNGYVPVRTTWSAWDDTGLSVTSLGRAIGTGAFTTVSTMACPTNPVSIGGSTDWFVAPRVIVNERSEASDTSANTSGWSNADQYAVNDYQINNKTLAYTGSWRAVYAHSYWYSGIKWSTNRGAQVSVTANGSSFAFVGIAGPSMGRMQVFVDGVSAGIVDLYAPVETDRFIAWSTSFDSVGSHTVTVQVLGTKNVLSTGTRVSFDAFAVIGPKVAPKVKATLS
jgi:hypothetical protein